MPPDSLIASYWLMAKRSRRTKKLCLLANRLFHLGYFICVLLYPGGVPAPGPLLALGFGQPTSTCGHS
ncbi:MAG TPA: hypothetical protein DCR87_06855 [Acidobacteria bacterium]|nr:hypothetical protein [Acidobacteriota bacterium]